MGELTARTFNSAHIISGYIEEMSHVLPELSESDRRVAEAIMATTVEIIETFTAYYDESGKNVGCAFSTTNRRTGEVITERSGLTLKS